MQLRVPTAGWQWRRLRKSFVPSAVRPRPLTALTGIFCPTTALSAVLLVPVLALCLKVAFRRMRQINYPEWLVIACYLTVQYFLIYLVWLPISKFLGLDQNIVAFLMVTANALTVAQFFAPEYAWYKSIVRTMVAFLLYFAIVLVAGMIGGFWMGYRAGLIRG